MLANGEVSALRVFNQCKTPQHTETSIDTRLAAGSNPQPTEKRAKPHCLQQAAEYLRLLTQAYAASTPEVPSCFQSYAKKLNYSSQAWKLPGHFSRESAKETFIAWMSKASFKGQIK